MKTYSFAFFLCLLSQILWAADQPVSSKIKNVTVFLEGAEVVREADFSFSQGNTTLVFSGLPALLKPQSIQVEGTGRFTVLSVSHELDYIEEQASSAKVHEFQEEAERVRMTIDELESMLAVYQEEEKLLYENRKLGGSEQGTAVSQIKEAADFYRSRLRDLKLRQLETRQKIKKLKEEESIFINSLREFKARKNQPTSKVLVKIEAAAPGKAGMRISYLVEKAGWLPAYDLRVKEVGEPLALHYKAQVHQQSGEDWQNVKLVISTGNPETNMNKPELPIQWVNFRENVNWQNNRNYSGTLPDKVQGRVTDGETGEALPGANVMVKGTTVGTVTDVNGNYTISIPGGSRILQFSFIGYVQQEVPIQNGATINVSLFPDMQSLEEVVVVGYGAKLEGRAAGVNVNKNNRRAAVESISIPDVAQTHNQITTEFTIAQPFTILSDGKMNMVEMQQHQLPAFYQYFAAPAKEEAAFLTAKITAWEEADLLSGEASLFFEGKFVGKTLIDLQQTKDTLEVSLGRDKNVMVKREEVKDYNKTSFFGGKQIEEQAFTISVRNAKQKNIQLLLKDRIPVSKNSDIIVETNELSGAVFNREKGHLHWNLELKPNSSLEKKVSYSLKYSRRKEIVFYEN